MFKLQEKLESTIDELFAAGELEERPDNLGREIANMLPSLVDSLAGSMLEGIKEDAPDTLKGNRKSLREFKKRLRQHWRKPLRLLELLVSLAIQVGDEFNTKYRDEAVGSSDAKFEALTRLHARACQVSSEILVLLNSGYADGAHARWRSLHEIAVVGSCIGRNGQELAERYLLHETVQRYKLACEYRKHQKKINVNPISAEEFDVLKTEYDELICRFGSSFESDYGWAAEVTKPKTPTISEIERRIGVDHMRPYYRWASDNVHPNSHGTYFRLGLSVYSGDALLAGPSSMGLADPGHATAVSLTLVSIILLKTKPTLDSVVVSEILLNLTDEIGESFLKAHRKREAMAMRESVHEHHGTAE